jgi:hypothetical protein
MKNSIYLILSFLLIGFACQENDDPATACGVNDPIENIAWLKQLAEESSTGGLSEFSYISQAKYKGKRVFYWASCCPNCSWALILRDCDGEALDQNITLDELEDIQVIWRPENFQCQF